MPNPVSPGTFNTFITSKTPFAVASPKTGSTGELNSWLSSTQPLSTYAEAVVTAPLLLFFVMI